MDLHKSLLAALITAGLIEADATQGEAAAALKAWAKASHVTLPADLASEDAVKPLVAALTKPAAPIPPAPAANPPAPPVRPEGIAAADVAAMVNLSSLDAQARNELLMEFLASNEPLTNAAVLNRINARVREQAPQPGTTRIQFDASEVDKFRVAARDALLVRTWGGSRPAQITDPATGEAIDWKPTAGGRNYGLQTMQGLARQLLMTAGVPASRVMDLTPLDLARVCMSHDGASAVLGRGYGGFLASDGPAFNVSGMFSNLMLDAANLMLRRSYDDSRTTFQVWMRQGPSVPDFKLVNKVIAGELGDPKAIPQDGEFEEVTLSDGKETYKLTLWGEVVSTSFELIVNDALSSFTEIPVKMGRAMRRKQNRLAYGVVKDNAALADTGDLFNATAITTAGGHNNLATGAGAPSVATLNTLTTKMMEQRGLDIASSAALNLMPRFLPHPPALRGTVLELLASVANPASSGNSGITNIWQNALDPITEAELGLAAGGSDTAWYLAADPNDVDTIEYAYLQGLETPVVETAVAFDRIGMRTRIYQAFAVKALDYRGLQKHAGA